MSRKPAPRRRTPRLMAAALDAAARGWPVFPLRPGGKEPALEDVNWEHWATTDVATIRRQWARKPYNVGISCGQAGLVIIDLDSSHGEAPPPQWPDARHGRDVLAQLATEAGELFPTGTYTVHTPGDPSDPGKHLYFSAPPDVDIRNTIGTLGWRIDSRAAGGYIVGAGSVRPDGRYTAANRAPVLPLPMFLTRQLEPPPPSARSVGTVATEHHAAYIQAAITGEVANVETAQTGYRRKAVLRAAGALGSFRELDEHTITTVLTAAARRCTGEHPLGDREVANAIRDGIAYGRARPRERRAS